MISTEAPAQASRRAARLAGTREITSRLEGIDWSFAASTTRGLTHAMHPWPAKFIPDIAASAIRLLSDPGDVVLDPMCGCGTTAVEAVSAARGSISVDVNPLAVRIAEGKCEVPNADQRLEIVEWSRRLKVREPTEAVLALAPAIPNRSYWFADQVCAELVEILDSIRSVGHSVAFLETVFSSVVNLVSRQESETRYRRIERETSAELTLERFRRRLVQALAMASSFDTVRSGCQRTYIVNDARHLSLEPGSADLAVFSPPYPNSFDYHLYHRFRMFWLGMDPRVVKKSEIGAHLRYEPDEVGWTTDMHQVLQSVASALADGGLCFCVVGNGIVKGREIYSSDLMWGMARDCGLEPLWRTTRDLRSSRKSFNLSDARLRREDVLVFRR